jgi:hypothetical protein
MPDFAKADALNTKANYVYKRIIEAMRTANTQKSILRDLHASMLDIHFLYRKELFLQCLELVQEAQELAKKIEALPYWIDLLRIELKIASIIHGTLEPAYTRKKYELIQQLHHKLLQSAAFYDLHHETIYLNQAKKPIDEDGILRSKINLHLDQLLDESNQEHEVFETKYNRYGIIANLIRLSPNSEYLGFFKQRNFELFDALHKRMEVFEAYPFQKEEDRVRYRIGVVNYIGQAFNLGKVKELDKFTSVLDEVKPSDPEFLSTVVYVNLLKKILDKDMLGAKEYLTTNRVWEVLALHGSKLVALRRYALYYHGGLVYFVREEFKEAIQWYESNLAESSALSKSNMLLLSDFFALLTRFELGISRKQEFKRLRLAAFNRRIEKDKLPKDSFEYFLSRSIAEIIDTQKDDDALKTLAKRLLPEAKSFILDKPNRTPFGVYLAWLESKAEGLPIRKTVDKYI